MRIHPELAIDCYKFGHKDQGPKGITRGLSNVTPRGSRIPGVDYVITAGFQGALQDFQELWEEEFFSKNLSRIIFRYERRTAGMLGPNNIGTDHITALHNLRYLPLRFRAIPEGTKVPLRVPIWTVENTHPDFAWLVTYIESYMSAETWLAVTSATTAYHFRTLLDEWAEQTSDTPEFVDWQGHDFSYRGMTSTESAIKSALGHLLSFAGTDTVAALDYIEDAYEPSAGAFLGGSVAATEHSVMCAWGAGNGIEGDERAFDHLLKTYPTGILSVVSDTRNLWDVLTKVLPDRKQTILAREGKLVVRPDSGDPADILCGTKIERWADGHSYLKRWDLRDENERNTPEEKGVIELLWDEFGGTINSKGYKVLDPHVGAIYGDSITYDRAKDILNRLERKDFASTNVVFGVGSFTYQYVTRDTFGMAMKATWAEIDGVSTNIFKDPVTDNGLKRSAKGRLAVFNKNGVPTLTEEATPEEEASSNNLLKIVWEDGEFVRFDGWDDIVARVGKRILR